MMKIKDLPEMERPREKALRYGIGKLSNEELLALLISSGTKDCPASEIAHRIIADSGGLYNAFHKTYHEFLHYHGIGKVTAIKLAACFELVNRYERVKLDDCGLKITSQYLYEKYASEIVGLSQEVLALVILDKRKMPLFETILYRGTETNIYFLNSDIFRLMSIYNGRFFYLIHNHPNGSLGPSKEDLEFTFALASEAKRLKFELIDHIIISRNGYYSFLSNETYR